MNEKLLKIGLVICASNYERHRNIIQNVHQALKEKGSYALYVITNYGAYYGKADFRHGEPSDFSLLESIDLDGCILEANLGHIELAEQIATILRKRQIPMVAINLSIDNVPSLNLQLKGAGEELMKHLIEDHGCTRINLALNQGDYVISPEMLEVYQNALAAHRIPYDPNRVLASIVSLEQGRGLMAKFDAAGTMADAEAVICVHDVCAIGLCQEAESRGVRVPEDLMVCSLNYSQNSQIYQPDLTGVDRMDQMAARMACDLLLKRIAGDLIPMMNYYEGEIRYGYSCGHEELLSSSVTKQNTLRQQAIGKIEMGARVSRMMQFNDSLEKAETLDDWADNMYSTLLDIGCKGFFCCLNQSDLPYIVSNREDHKTAESEAYDATMTLVTGFSRRTGEIRNLSFPLETLVPVQAEAGDQFLVLPVHHGDRSYGYMVFLNDDLPIEQYVFRIFHESLGNSIDNLHKKMILKSNIQELDRLHMEDQMTGLYNRFGLKRFAAMQRKQPAYTTVMIDMDGLKKINDTYGHQAGNNAICMIAEALKAVSGKEDLVVRYGGDEFLVISENINPAYWEQMKETLNTILQSGAEKQKLPYAVGVSVGYAISAEDGADKLETQLERADQAMYQNKKERSLRRKG